jgi:hypothetical protein
LISEVDFVEKIRVLTGLGQKQVKAVKDWVKKGQRIC